MASTHFVARFLELTHERLMAFEQKNESQKRIAVHIDRRASVNMGSYEEITRDFVSALLISRQDNNVKALNSVINRIQHIELVPNDVMIMNMKILNRTPRSWGLFIQIFEKFVMYYEDDIKDQDNLCGFFRCIAPTSTQEATTPSRVLMRLMKKRPLEQTNMPILPIVAMCQLLLLAA